MTFATKTNTGQIPNPKPSPLETVEIRGINAVVGLFPPNSHCHNENSLFGINAAFSPSRRGEVLYLLKFINIKFHAVTGGDHFNSGFLG
jgi:hypothetical protein